jgi:hypothetical protein
VAVGGVTGLVVALVAAVGAVQGVEGEVGRVLEWVGLLLGVSLLGPLLGATLGGVAGTPGGVLNAVLQPHVRGDRAAWWSTLLVAALTAAGVVGTVAGWQLSRNLADPGTEDPLRHGLRAGVLALVPALVGGWLSARTGRGIRARRREARAGRHG